MALLFMKRRDSVAVSDSRAARRFSPFDLPSKLRG